MSQKLHKSNMCYLGCFRTIFLNKKKYEVDSTVCSEHNILFFFENSFYIFFCLRFLLRVITYTYLIISLIGIIPSASTSTPH